MNAVVYDGSVWIGAQDSVAPFCTQSRMFFNHVLTMGAREQAVSPAFLAKALALGTAEILRWADVINFATVDSAVCTLVSGDNEHHRRACAPAPDAWLVAKFLP
jgi:hypothetical protein